jgi:hypothetical protein
MILAVSAGRACCPGEELKSASGRPVAIRRLPVGHRGWDRDREAARALSEGGDTLLALSSPHPRVTVYLAAHRTGGGRLSQPRSAVRCLLR